MGRRVCIRELDPDSNQNLQVTSDKKYLWDGVEIAQERTADGGTVLRQFFKQGFVDTDGTVLFYTKDHLGSVRELTDGTQAVQARYDYDPYGRMVQVSGSRISPVGYAGLVWHAQSGLDFAVHRAYDPNLGRWINRDPIGEYGGINLYAYVAGNVINANDLLGYCYQNASDVTYCKLKFNMDLNDALDRIQREADADTKNWRDQLHYWWDWYTDKLSGKGGRGDARGGWAYGLMYQWEVYKVNKQYNEEMKQLNDDVMAAKKAYEEGIKTCVLCDQCPSK
jgi:RHS repeat-associated protein